MLVLKKFNCSSYLVFLSSVSQIRRSLSIKIKQEGYVCDRPPTVSFKKAGARPFQRDAETSYILKGSGPWKMGLTVLARFP